MIDMSIKIRSLYLKNPVFLAAGPLTTKLENLIQAEELGLGAVDTKVTLSRKYPKIKCYERAFWDPGTRIMNWNLGLWDGEFICIDDAVAFIKMAKQELSIPVFGNFKEDSDQVEQWIMLAKRLEDAGADALVTFFTFIREFVGKEIEMLEKIIAPVCSAVSIPVIFKLQPIAGLFADIPRMATVMEEVGLSAIQISDGVGGYPSLAIDAPPYHPFNCLDFQARDGFISGPYLKPLVYKTVYEYSNQTDLPIICSGGIWDAPSAIEAILYGSSVIASASGPCIKGWEMFTDIIQGIENYMQENNYSRIGDFKGLAGQYIKENDQIDYPDCYAAVDASKCNGCEQCLPPAHCNAIFMDQSLAKINKEGCVGCCICKYLCPENAIEMKMG
jgi:dihydroorotate dehydrogenase/NAD-dependent dihydropyrimidine dehydrogenase PreA subunit